MDRPDDGGSYEAADSRFAEIQIAEAREEFYRTVQEALSQWAQDIGAETEYAEYIPQTPSLLRLLENLALENEVSTKGKAQIAVALSYFSAPQDSVPEAMVGPCAYVDDVALAASVADTIADTAGEEVVRRCWPGDDDPRPVIDGVLEFARYAMGSEVWSEVREGFRKQVGHRVGSAGDSS